MALILCEECHKEISDKALSCPSCGVPRPANVDNQTVPTPTVPSRPKHLKFRTALRFRSDADLSEIKKALAEKINAIDSKFDSSTMCKTTSGIIDLVVDVSKEERDCLISVDHNLRKKSLNGAATMLVGIVLILLAWIIFNGWAAVAVLVVLLWNKHIEDNSISVDRLDDCLSSLKAEFEKK